MRSVKKGSMYCIALQLLACALVGRPIAVATLLLIGPSWLQTSCKEHQFEFVSCRPLCVGLLCKHACPEECNIAPLKSPTQQPCGIF